MLREECFSHLTRSIQTLCGIIGPYKGLGLLTVIAKGDVVDESLQSVSSTLVEHCSAINDFFDDCSFQNSKDGESLDEELSKELFLQQRSWC